MVLNNVGTSGIGKSAAQGAEKQGKETMKCFGLSARIEQQPKEDGIGVTGRDFKPGVCAVALESRVIE